MLQHKIILIKNEIEEIREYLETELCTKCENMRLKLIALQSIIDQYQDPDHTRELDQNT